MGERARRKGKPTKVLIPSMRSREWLIMPDGRRIWWYDMLDAHLQTARAQKMSFAEEQGRRAQRRTAFETMAQTAYLYKRGYLPSQIDGMLNLGQNTSKYWLEQGGWHKDCSPRRDAYHDSRRKPSSP